MGELASPFFSIAVVNFDGSRPLNKVSLNITDPNILLLSQDYPTIESGQSSTLIHNLFIKLKDMAIC
jgi:hypothetical protein